jgi:hypothetical protein
MALVLTLVIAAGSAYETWLIALALQPGVSITKLYEVKYRSVIRVRARES